MDERKVRKWREKKKRMPRLQPYYSTINALIFFFFHFHICSFSFSRTLFLLSCITQLLLRYAYLSNEHRTKSEIKIKIILFAIMISSFDSVCLLTSITFHFLAQYSHSFSSIISCSMNRKREKIYIYF